jgi:Flp pilus assembly protein TadG
LDSKVPLHQGSRTSKRDSDEGDGILATVISLAVLLICTTLTLSFIDYLYTDLQLQGVADQAVRAATLYLGPSATLTDRTELGASVIYAKERSLATPSWSYSEGTLTLVLRLYLTNPTDEILRRIGFTYVTVHASAVMEPS